MTPGLHLSRVRLRDPIRSTQALHGLSMELVAEAGERVLWALPLRDLLVVQGAGPARVTARCARQVAEVTTAPVPLDWEVGEMVALSLIACPTRMDPLTRKRRTVAEGDLVGWLTRKLADAVGVVESHHHVLGLRAGGRAGSRVAHRWVAYDAVAEVHDPTALRDLVRSGVGSGKAYGAGLLLVGCLG